MIELFGAGLQGKSPKITAQKRLNLYFEIQTIDQDRTRVAVYGTPGTELFVDFGDTPCRGAHAVGDNLYIVHRGTLWSVNNAGVKTNKGTLNSTSGKVDMDDNGDQVIIVDGSDGYIYDSTYDTFAEIKQYSTGTTTSTTANKLVDSGATFQTDGVKAGQFVYNTTDSTTAVVTAVDSETTLSLNSDIFTSGENYEVGTDAFPDNASTVTYQDGYFIVSNTDNDRFNISGINQGFDWDALDFDSAESSPDALIRVMADHGELILFGNLTTETWSNTGATDFPYARVSGLNNEWGLAAKWSLAKGPASLFYLGKNRMGEVVVLQKFPGSLPKRISNHELEHIINGYSDVTDASGYAYMLGGHPLYQLNFPNAGFTWLYDGSTEIWSELESKDLTRHIGEIYTNYLNQNIVCDYTSGKVYKLKPDVYTDNGDEIRRLIRGRHVVNEERKLTVDFVQLVMETGVGLETGQGSDPQAMMRYSKDGGQTWSTELWASIGKIGEYLTRVIWRRLGSSRDWVFEFSISDPIKIAIAGVQMKARPHKR